MQLGLWEMVSAGRGISESGGENARIRRNFSVAIISRICYNGDMEAMRNVSLDRQAAPAAKKGSTAVMAGFLTFTKEKPINRVVEVDILSLIHI